LTRWALSSQRLGPPGIKQQATVPRNLCRSRRGDGNPKCSLHSEERPIESRELNLGPRFSAIPSELSGAFLGVAFLGLSASAILPAYMYGTKQLSVHTLNLRTPSVFNRRAAPYSKLAAYVHSSVLFGERSLGSRIINYMDIAVGSRSHAIWAHPMCFLVTNVAVPTTARAPREVWYDDGRQWA